MRATAALFARVDPLQRNSTWNRIWDTCRIWGGEEGRRSFPLRHTLVQGREHGRTPVERPRKDASHASDRPREKVREPGWDDEQATTPSPRDLG